VRIYPGELHAFHALVWRRQARQSWRETFDFLAESLPSGSDRLATSR
jgi:acetyl esterase